MIVFSFCFFICVMWVLLLNVCENVIFKLMFLFLCSFLSRFHKQGINLHLVHMYLANYVAREGPMLDLS